MNGQFPSAIDLPTGLGKTSVMTIWYLAWKTGAAIPRRLVYIVDRRTVVDQATIEAERIKDRSGDTQLKISTLRGKHIDNREWLEDPAAPAIIVGTVDMIGSRLLFEGYGVSRYMRPYHAAMLAIDTFLVLDEAHLVQPFEALLRRVAERGGDLGPQDHAHQLILPPTCLIALSATGFGNADAAFQLEEEDRHDDIVSQRLGAPKWLELHEAKKTTVAGHLAKAAWSIASVEDSRSLIFCNSRKAAEEVVKELQSLAKEAKEEINTQLLVGARRVKEREEIWEWLTQYGYIGEKRDLACRTFLVATSAGEVGVDLDADHMVCDLVAWERMVQRFGRVNRKGRGYSKVHVIAEKPNEATNAVWALLSRLPNEARGVDVSPGAILDLKQRARNDAELQERIEAASTQPPLRPELTRALLDAWSLTNLKEHTGRPEIAPWLRGWEAQDEPQTRLLWREFLPDTPAELERYFEIAPPHLSEILETRTSEVIAWLKERSKAADAPNVLGFLLDTPSGYIQEIRKDTTTFENLRSGFICLDRRVGGLCEKGLLAAATEHRCLTIDTDLTWTERAGLRIYSTDLEEDPPTSAWEEIGRFKKSEIDDDTPPSWIVVERLRPGSASVRTRNCYQPLEAHQEAVQKRAEKIGERLGVPIDCITALSIAASAHDEGKRASRWQRAFGNTDETIHYAKTPRIIAPQTLGGYRHETGSVVHLLKSGQLHQLSDHQQDLALHLVAAHHGRARPCLVVDGCEAPPSQLSQIALESMMRFERLQIEWGPWGLAWWETLLRAVDQQASRDIAVELERDV